MACMVIHEVVDESVFHDTDFHLVMRKGPCWGNVAVMDLIELCVNLQACCSNMEVIGAGFGRTGTLSLKTALEILDLGPCYHMFEVVSNPDDIQKWLDVAAAVERGEKCDWEMIFDPADGRPRYKSGVDHPVSGYYRQLLAAYPTAKVILTIRDSPEAWYDSVRSTIGRGMPWELMLFPRARRFQRMVQKTIWNNQLLFQGKVQDRQWALQRYRDWIEEVKSSVPPDQLLVFNVKQGWEPLCKFLGVPVPDQPFPRVNDRQSFLDKKSAKHGQAKTVVYSALGVIALVAAIGIGSLLRKRA